MRSAKDAAKAWKEAYERAAQNYTVGVNALEMAREAYVAERLTLAEFEAEVAALLAREA